MKGSGYIRIDRGILDWGWYGDANTMRVFLHLLLSATYKDREITGEIIPRGSCLTSVKRLSEDLGITTQGVRTALNHLKSTNEITIKTTPKFSVITVVKYDYYQTDNNQDNKQLTNKQQTTNKQLTTYKKEKKEKGKKDNILSGNDGASYDIYEALRRAETTVPTVRKRGKQNDGN